MIRRLAASRVEVLVIVLIVALVLGLGAAGLVRIRDAARLTNCSNNLRQFGLAVRAYHDSCDSLPPLVDQGNGAPTGQGLPSVFACLMPYLESDPWSYHTRRTPAEYHSHSSVEFTFQAKDQTFTERGGIANQHRRTFLCPAESPARRLRDVPMTLPDGTTGYYATGSYAANGLLPWGSGTIPGSFPRGIENTVLMGERPQVCRTAAGDEVYNLWGVGFYSPHMPAFAALTPGDPPGLPSTGQAAPVEPLPPGDGLPLIRIGRQDAVPEPLDFPRPFQRVRDDRACDPRLPGGLHSAGMQVLMADGGVRVFDWDTTPRVFWGVCVPGGQADGR